MTSAGACAVATAASYTQQNTSDTKHVVDSEVRGRITMSTAVLFRLLLLYPTPQVEEEGHEQETSMVEEGGQEEEALMV